MALPSSIKPWRRDSQCPPPSGRPHVVALATLTQPLAYMRNARMRGETVDACALEIAQACVTTGARAPFRHVLELLSDDGDSLSLALHAMALGQWTLCGHATSAHDSGDPPFAAFSIAGAPICSRRWEPWSVSDLTRPLFCAGPRCHRVAQAVCRARERSRQQCHVQIAHACSLCSPVAKRRLHAGFKAPMSGPDDSSSRCVCTCPVLRRERLAYDRIELAAQSLDPAFACT